MDIKKIALKSFQITAILEGISYLLLIAVTMPLKYWAGIARPNIWIGYAHGVLFIAFFVILAFVAFLVKWKFRKILILALASFLPFGTFYAEKKGISILSRNFVLLADTPLARKPITRPAAPDEM